LIVKSGRYGGTYAHKDIAFKFVSLISIEFELFIVKEFQQLKEEEQKQLGWSARRECGYTRNVVAHFKGRYSLKTLIIELKIVYS
jgi:hypothetical protein